MSEIKKFMRKETRKQKKRIRKMKNQTALSITTMSKLDKR
jgi:hypothetical protein